MSVCEEELNEIKDVATDGLKNWTAKLEFF